MNNWGFAIGVIVVLLILNFIFTLLIYAQVS